MNNTNINITTNLIKARLVRDRRLRLASLHTLNSLTGWTSVLHSKQNSYKIWTKIASVYLQHICSITLQLQKVLQNIITTWWISIYLSSMRTLHSHSYFVCLSSYEDSYYFFSQKSSWMKSLYKFHSIQVVAKWK